MANDKEQETKTDKNNLKKSETEISPDEKGKKKGKQAKVIINPSKEDLVERIIKILRTKL